MTTYHTVTANLESLLTPGLRSPVVTVRSNVPASAALVDLDNNKIIVSSDRVQLVDKSTFSISLIDTAGAGTNVPDGSLRWTIQVDYTDARGARKTWICGDFTLTADLDLSDAVATADPPATIANQYLAQMQALIDEAEAITGLTGEDAAVATLVGNPASATRAALSATYVAMAPAPTGVKATDEANVQPLINTAQSTGGTVLLQAGTYKMDLVTTKMDRQPNIIGKGKGVTKIDGSILLNGVSGSLTGGYLSDFSWVGTNPTKVALEIRGACNVKWDRIGVVGTYAGGILFHNYASGDFTEMCSGEVQIEQDVAQAIEYRVTSGNGSFHGSGLMEGSTINQKTGGSTPSILIGTGAMVYNAPLHAHVWTRGRMPVIQHNGANQSNMYGHLNVEAFNPGAILGAGTTLPFIGAISYFGNSLVSIGTIQECDHLETDGTRYTARRDGASILPQDGAIMRQTNDGTEWASLVRKNFCPNPSAESGSTSGWLGYAGSALSVSSAWAAFGINSIRGQVTGGTTRLGVLNLVSVPTLAAGQVWTIGVTVVSDHDTIVTVSGRHSRAISVPDVLELDGQNYNLFAGEPRRFVIQTTVPVPPGGGTATGIGFQVKETNAGTATTGQGYNVDGLTLELGVTAGSYFDGDRTDSEWLGVPYASASVQRPTLPPGLRGTYVNAASGASVTLPSTKAFHQITMSANCTLAFQAPDGLGHSFRLQLLGSFVPTWPGSVSWADGSAPTYASGTLYQFSTLNGGTTWVGQRVKAPVQSVNGYQGTVVLAAPDVGAVPTSRQLAGLDLTADRTAAALKTALAIGESDVANLTTDLAAKVPATRQVNGHALSADVTVTKADVGLSNVPNVDTTNASNITTGTLPSSVMPPLAINDVFTVASQAAMLALTAQRGDVAIRTDITDTFILSTDSPSTLADWKEIRTPADGVTSVNGSAGPSVVLAASDVGAVPTTRQVNGHALSADIALASSDVGAQTKFVAGTCGTASGTVAKTVTIASYTLTAGDVLAITFTNGSQVSGATLAVNGGSAIAINAGGTIGQSTFSPASGAVCLFYYDGTTFWSIGIQNGQGVPSQSEAEVGTAGTPRFWTAQRAKQAAANTQINTQTGTTYTFALTDVGCRVEGSNAGAITFTIPPNSSVAFSIGTWIEVEQYGAGAITIAAGAGVTLRSRGALVNTNGQYSVVRLYKRATDEWVLSGDRV